MAKVQLSESHIARAHALYRARPAVIPGTNAIIDEAERNAWYARVNKETIEVFGNITEWPAPSVIKAWFDLCGVPD